jgi:hypothetical protein
MLLINAAGTIGNMLTNALPQNLTGGMSASRKNHPIVVASEMLNFDGTEAANTDIATGIGGAGIDFTHVGYPPIENANSLANSLGGGDSPYAPRFCVNHSVF